MGIFQRGENWFVDYRIHGQRKREKIGPSKKLAEEVLHKRLIQIAENRYLDIKREDKIKFSDFADLYLHNHSRPNKKSWRSTDNDLVKNLTAFFHDRFLHDITPMLVEQYKARRKNEVSHVTVNRSLSCLRCMFNKAIAWGKTKENPVKQVKFLREENKRTRFLEKEEISRLLAQCSERLNAVVMVTLNTGMRKNEVANLKWRDIDFARGVITLLETKNGEKRHIPMNSACREALTGTEKHPSSEHVFCEPNGEPYNFRKAFDTALKRAGISNFRFHDLRHTFASHLVMAGVDLNTVRELLGHKDISLTIRYSHLSPSHKAQAVEILAKKLDTFWTLGDLRRKNKKSSNVITIEEVYNSPLNAHVAQPVEQRFYPGLMLPGSQ